MRFLFPIRPLLMGWLLSASAFGFVAFLHIGQFALAYDLPLEDSLRIAARDWLPWVVVTPLLFRFVSRVPLVRGDLKHAVPLHMSVALLTLLACALWAWYVVPYGNGTERPTNRPGSEVRSDQGSLGKAGGERGEPPQKPRRHAPYGPPPGPFFLQFGFRLPAYLAVLSLAHAMYFYRRSQDREKRALELEASLATAHLAALRMQLAPHFLFNSLNAVAELVHKSPATADAMLVALSKLLRLTLEASDTQEVPLYHEMEFINYYLAVERARFGDRIRVELEIEKEVRSALVPTFILQPLVENAMRHGLEQRGGNGLLVIRARRVGGSLWLHVIDDGPGFVGPQPSREGVGLSNARARLRALYGDAAWLAITSKPVTMVAISLPFRTVL